MSIRDVSEKHSCRGCGVCAAVCPVHAINMQLDKQGFYYASVLEKKCIQCGKCEKVCSVINTGASSQTAKKVYYAYNKDDIRRMQSSSGGIVGALVLSALSEGYAVIGASYDYDTNRVHHVIIDSIEDYYDKIAGSKYIPSNTVDAFEKICEIQKCMVIGTPCQIKALRAAYPDKDMICIDFRCFGVCGYTLWDKYIKSINRKYGKKIVCLNSRSKMSSWLKWGIKIDFEDGEIYFKPKTVDNFGRIFSGMEHAGKNCLECTMSGENSFADIRVEDGWQLSDWLSKEDYKKGVSQVTVMSDKGMKLWEASYPYIYWKEVGFEHAIHGCNKPKPKEYLNGLIDDPNMEIEEIIHRYNRTVPIYTRIFNYLCNLLFDVPRIYFGVKRIYRKIRKMDE